MCERKSKYATYLVTSPKKPSNEDDNTDDGKKSADKINLANDFPVGQASGVDSRGWEIEKEGRNQADKGPDTAN